MLGKLGQGFDWEVGLFGEDFFPDEMLTHSTPLSTSTLVLLLARLLTYAPEDKKSFFPFPHVQSLQLGSAQAVRPSSLCHFGPTGGATYWGGNLFHNVC